MERVCKYILTKFISFFSVGDLYHKTEHPLLFDRPEYLDAQSSKEHDSFRDSEWEPEAAEEMCNKVQDFLVPDGMDGKTLTLGHYFDRTPKDLISKVVLEQKGFDTWFGGRTVLLADGKTSFRSFTHVLLQHT